MRDAQRLGEPPVRRVKAVIEGAAVHRALLVGRQVGALVVLAVHRREQLEVGYRRRFDRRQHRYAQFCAGPVPAVAKDDLVLARLVGQRPHQNRLDVATGHLDVVLESGKGGIAEGVGMTVRPAAGNDAARVELAGRRRALMLLQPLAQLAQFAFGGQHLAAELQHLARTGAGGGTGNDRRKALAGAAVGTGRRPLGRAAGRHCAVGRNLQVAGHGQQFRLGAHRLALRRLSVHRTAAWQPGCQRLHCARPSSRPPRRPPTPAAVAMAAAAASSRERAGWPRVMRPPRGCARPRPPIPRPDRRSGRRRPPRACRSWPHRRTSVRRRRWRTPPPCCS